MGTIQAGLDEVPVCEWGMAIDGDEYLPSDEDVKDSAEIIRHPVKAYDEVRDGVEIVSPPAEDSWLDRLFEGIDALLGRLW